MPTPPSPTDPQRYLQYLRRSRLVSEPELAAVHDELVREAGSSLLDARPLGKRLVDRGLLTPWQNWHLLSGRYKGFFLGRYRLLDYLGSGGMSRVYLAEHTILHRRVAIKLLTEREPNSLRLRRFFLESQANAALNHPNIRRVYDFDQDGQFYFLVMEYVDGPDLYRLVRDEGPLAYETAADYLAQASEALAHAHSRAMIHRDVKPANLMVDRSGVVKLLDLGVVRWLEGGDTSLTSEGDVQIIGTVDYLPPEQFLDGHNVDYRADLYSLGCTFYYLLTGRPPFNQGNQSQRIMMHQSEPAPSVYLTRPDAPPALVRICQRLMAKAPADRYQSAVEVGHRLRQWLHARAGIAVRPAEPSRLRADGAQPLAGPHFRLRAPGPPESSTPEANDAWEAAFVETSRSPQLATLLVDGVATPASEAARRDLPSLPCACCGYQPAEQDLNDHAGDHCPRCGEPWRSGPTAPALSLRLRAILEQVLKDIRAGREQELAILLDSFTLPNAEEWFRRVYGSARAGGLASKYSQDVVTRRGELLDFLREGIRRPDVEVQVRGHDPRQLTDFQPWAAGLTKPRQPIALFTINLTSKNRRWAAMEFGPFVYVGAAFRLLCPREGATRQRWTG